MEDELWRLRSIEADLHQALDDLADLQTQLDDMKVSRDSALSKLGSVEHRANMLQSTVDGCHETIASLERKLLEAQVRIEHYERVDRMKIQDFTVVGGDFVDYPEISGTGYSVKTDVYIDPDDWFIAPPVKKKVEGFKYREPKDAAFKKRR